MGTATEFEAMIYARAATNQHLLKLKDAIRSSTSVNPQFANIVCQCIDNAYGHGFSEGAMHAVLQANDYANDMRKRDQENPQWLRDLNTGAKDPR